MKFPDVFAQKVDMNKVNREQIKRWVSQRLVELFEGLEDEVLINYVGAHVDQPVVDPEEMLLSLNDMLERDAASFMEELWTLLVDAQNQPGGIPKALIQSAKAEIDARMQERGRVTQGMRHMGHPSALRRNPPPAPHNIDSSRSYGLQTGDRHEFHSRGPREYRERQEEERNDRKIETLDRSDAPKPPYDDGPEKRPDIDRYASQRVPEGGGSRHHPQAQARHAEQDVWSSRPRYDHREFDEDRAPRQLDERERYRDNSGRYEREYESERRYDRSGRGGRSRRHRESEDYDTPYSRGSARREEDHPGADPFGRDARPAPP